MQIRGVLRRQNDEYERLYFAFEMLWEGRQMSRTCFAIKSVRSKEKGVLHQNAKAKLGYRALVAAQIIGSNIKCDTV